MRSARNRVVGNEIVGSKFGFSDVAACSFRLPPIAEAPDRTIVVKQLLRAYLSNGSRTAHRDMHVPMRSLLRIGTPPDSSRDFIHSAAPFTAIVGSIDGQVGIEQLVAHIQDGEHQPV
jgi:hypothetical protein